jgi:Na+(H+)/acetate symporter ActP
LIPFLFVVAITIATLAIGTLATRGAKTAKDFFVAGRSVGVTMNAAAISGEYLSAASFMGIAGLVMKSGYDALWYPAGYAAGYLFLLLFIAGPLRRFGAYTIPDFAQGRFDSPGFRKVAVTFVLCIGFFYTMPQMKGAGVTMTSILGWPYWAGILVVGAVITFNVAGGGMKSITLVQAFQYWAKLFAISLPVFVLASVYGGYGSVLENERADWGAPAMRDGQEVRMRGAAAFPNNILHLSPYSAVRLEFPEGAKIARVSMVRPSQPGEADVRLGRLLRNENRREAYDWSGPVELPTGTVLTSVPTAVLRNGAPVPADRGNFARASAKIEFAEPTRIVFRQDGFQWNDQNSTDFPLLAPNAPPHYQWLYPFGPLTSKHGYPLLYTFSLIVALVCGTAGLPHILVRFYTNPDGRAAKRTTLWVMVMLGAFYVFTPMWGAYGRYAMPELYASNSTDAAVIRLPTTLPNELLGQILSGVTSAGAFAAFMSTFSGLLVSMAGAFAHDIYGNMLRPGAPPESRRKAFQWAAVGVGAVSMGLGLFVESFDIAMMVGWAFAIGAASYFPLLLLGAWWKGLSVTGAATGMLLGGIASLVAIVTSMLLDRKILDLAVSPLVRSLLEQPAIWGVPLAIVTMVVVSLLTPQGVPANITEKMLHLHAPEELGYSRNYVD